MRKLNDVTLVCASSVRIQASLMSLRYCMRQMEFESVKLITHDPTVFSEDDITVEPCRWLTSTEAYSHFMIYDLHRHIQTKYCLVVQHDGFIINADAWDDDFYNYDYIGAPWPLLDGHFLDPYGGVRRVGNGGFSFRSKKLLEVSAKEYVPFVGTTHGDFFKHHRDGYCAEDVVICIHNAPLYERHGCKFAPYEVACKFSRECTVDMDLQRNTFGTHGPMNIWINEYDFSNKIEYFI